MVRVRKLVLAIAAASALGSGAVQALGLGEIDLKSSLSQPLVAEIELLEVRDLTQAELMPALASPEDFSKAGVDRQYALTDLKFTPVIRPGGKSVIRITSSKPMREPYLNFLVEVLWPNGRLLREYTLLIDPPTYSPSPVLAAPSRLPAVQPQVQRPGSAQAPAASRPATAPARPAAGTGTLDSDQYKTTTRDTLWDIAQRTRQGGTVQQAMMAIQALNPEAFIDGNINRLKSGQVLRLPNAEQINQLSRNEAQSQVAEQVAAWRNGRSAPASTARQLDATHKATAAAAPAQTSQADSLKLVAADAGRSASGNDKGAAELKALGEQLAVTKESLDSSRRENDELNSRMTDLQSQLDKLQRLIELKDSQLARLQADLAAGEVQPAAADAPAQTPVAESPAELAAPLETHGEPVPAPAAEPVAAAPEVQAAAEAPVPVAQPKPVEVAPAAVVEAPVAEPEEQALLDSLLANPMLLGAAGGGALLVLLLALMAMSRRRALQESQQAEAGMAVEKPGFSQTLADVGDSLPELDDSAFSAPASAAPQAEGERLVPQTADPLGEADIYIAYGKFAQAAELLHNAINDESQRGDLRLKLMEVCAEQGDRDGFARQEQELREIGGSLTAVEQLKSRYPGMVPVASSIAGSAAAALAVDDALDNFSLDDLTLDDPQPRAAEALDSTFELPAFDEPMESEPAATAAALDDLGLDFSIGLDDVPAPAPAAVDEFALDLDLDAPAAAGEGGFDLGNDLADFSLDLDSAAAPVTASALEDDFSLDLSDALTVADQPAADAGQVFSLEDEFAASAPEMELSSDFDLSLADEPAAPALEAGDFAAQLDQVSADLGSLGDEFGLDLALDAPAAAAVENDLGIDLAAELAAELPALSGTEPALAAGLGMSEDDFDFIGDTDESTTKLDLAAAYIDLGDAEGARDILDEVLVEGSESQQQAARELLGRLS